MDVNNLSNILLGRTRRMQQDINNVPRQITTQVNEMKQTLTQEMKQEVAQQISQQVYNWRTYDGSGNNIFNPSWGSASTALSRKSGSAYADGVSTLATRGTGNPNPRTISDNICTFVTDEKNAFGLSDMIWGWGQFVDHEIDLTPDNAADPANITTEDAPPRTINFKRSIIVSGSNPREQPNKISSFIDATNVYGCNAERTYALRKLDGTGKMKTSGANLLPLNENKLDNASLSGQTVEDMFLAGDIRANENVLLTGLHTLFVREHNRLCDVIVQNDSSLEGKEEIVFQTARKLVIGIMQKITYKEYLPALLGSQMFSASTFYNQSINPSIVTEFSTVGYRLGHGMISSNVNVDGGTDVKLKDVFFNPDYVKTNGIENVLVGATKQTMKKIDNQLIDDLRNFLFGPPTSTHVLDLASLNIQRGRDHGIPGYNTVRVAYGLSAKTNFSNITSDTKLQSSLAATYDTVNDIDPWVGALCETHVAGSPVGELIGTILTEQFRRLRDGDRFWYENDSNLTSFELGIINGTMLGDVINRNTNKTVSGNVFYV